MNSKRGTSLVTDWSLKQKVSYNKKSPNNILAIFGKTKCYQQQEGSRNCCKNCLGYLPSMIIKQLILRALKKNSLISLFGKYVNQIQDEKS